MKKILYLGYYDTDENKEQNRAYVLSAANKMSYICSVINRAGWEVELVSASRTQNKKGCKGKRVRVSENTELLLFPSVGMGGKLKRAVRALAMNWRLFWYLLNNARRNDSVLVYHSLGYVKLVWLLKKLKGFRLILEVEEVYADVNGDERARKWEYRLFNAADAYLFPTELLDKKLNLKGKPSGIIYGTYQVEADRGERFNDGKIHLLYAGTLDPRKGGALAAVSAAKELSDNYHIHILGFGSEEEKSALEVEIGKINSLAGARVSYDGLLSGEEYIRFVQCCHIGLSSQIPDAAFNESSFPSKVLSYLANGLRVASVRLAVLEKSKISGLLCYYDEDTPKAIAKTVESINCSSPYDSREVVRRLDVEFGKSMEELLRDK